MKKELIDRYAEKLVEVMRDRSHTTNPHTELKHNFERILEKFMEEVEATKNQ